MAVKPQNLPQTLNTLSSPINQWLLGATNGIQGQTMIDF